MLGNCVGILVFRYRFGLLVLFLVMLSILLRVRMCRLMKLGWVCLGKV